MGNLERNDAHGGRDDLLEAGASFFFPFLGGMKGTDGRGWEREDDTL